MVAAALVGLEAKTVVFATFDRLVTVFAAPRLVALMYIGDGPAVVTVALPLCVELLEVIVVLMPGAGTVMLNCEHAPPKSLLYSTSSKCLYSDRYVKI